MIALDEILPEDLPVAVQTVLISMGHLKISQGPVVQEVVGRVHGSVEIAGMFTGKIDEQAASPLLNRDRVQRIV